jgi:hypothetical protein
MNHRQVLLLSEDTETANQAISAYALEFPGIEVLWFRSEIKLAEYVSGSGCYAGRGVGTNIECITIDPSFEFEDFGWLDSMISSNTAILEPKILFLPGEKRQLPSFLCTRESLSFRSALLRKRMDTITRPLVKHLIRNRKSELLLQQL